MISIFLILGVVVQLQLVASIQVGFPKKKYVKPGDPFDLTCQIEEGGIVGEFYSPAEDVPSDTALVKKSKKKTDYAFIHESGTYNKNYVKASKRKHAGFYTCVIFLRDEPYIEKAVCEVIIKDLCKNVQCPDPKTCVADYETGTTSCQCVFDCPQFDIPESSFICTDHCETMSHECEMKEKNCLDGKDRKVWRSGGFCPFPYQKPKRPSLFTNPNIQNLYPKVGEEVDLSSGLLNDGEPPVEISWTKDSVDLPRWKDQRMYTFTATFGMRTYIECKIYQCRDISTAAVMRYYIETPDKPDEDIYPVCSVYPGGAIEQFNSQSAYYDLACTHVMAADFGPGGDYTNPWFIYGTFDQRDGNTALMSMTVFIGSTAFEFQRGWIINVGGSKFPVMEGVARTIGVCEVMFTGQHLRAACPFFYVYFDGTMSGHIRLGTFETSPSKAESVKGRTNIGLCWDNESGFRENWQIPSSGSCSIQPGKEGCEDSGACDRFVLASYQDSALQWASRGRGAHQACNELTCEGSTPSPDQECALNQANLVNLHLRVEKQLTDAVAVEQCPENCDWKEKVVDGGCPQYPLPYVCA